MSISFVPQDDPEPDEDKQTTSASFRDVLKIAGEGRPTMQMIRAGDIQIDPKYQRHLKQSRAIAMAESFDWNLAMMLGVNERTPGSYWCFDGQHRLHAVTLAFNDDEPVPCYVTHNLTLEDEARLFYMLQTTRRNLSPAERFNARLVAREPIALEIQEIVERCGFHIPTYASSAHSNSRTIGAVYTIEQIHDLQGNYLELTLRTIAEAWAYMEMPKGSVIMAIARVLRKGRSVESFNYHRFVQILRNSSPSMWLDKAQGMQRLMGGAASRWVEPMMIREYNNKLTKSKQLPMSGIGATDEETS